MFDLSKYEVLTENGFPKQGKFSRTFLLKDKQTSKKYLLKTVTKNPKNSVAIEALKNESNFHFEQKGLPTKGQLLETEKEWLFLKNFQEGKDLLSTFQILKKRNRLVFLQLLMVKLEEIFTILELEQIVHADIRPENILITPINKNDFEVNLIDFGLSFHSSNPPKRRVLFHLLYSSPEIILNELEYAGPKSDIYSFGLVLYRLLSKEAPFHHSNPSVLTNLALTYPLERNTRIPKDVWKTIEWMCTKTAFRTAPNKMTINERSKLLVEAVNKRPSWKEIVQEARTWNTRYGWFSTNSNLFDNLG